MNKDRLGEFEELILTIVAILSGDAYGNSIVAEIENQLHRTVNLGGVHVTLRPKFDVAHELAGAF